MFEKLIEYKEMREAIQRVRDLANKFESEPSDEMVNYHLVAKRILIALDSKQQ